MERNSYIHKRFEDYMTKVDRGELPRDIALTALREEVEYAEQEQARDAGEETANGNNPMAASE